MSSTVKPDGSSNFTPRVTQYTGRIVVTLDSIVTQNALSVDATSGQTVDVCAAIS